MVVVARFYNQYIANLDGFAPAVDLNKSASLQNAEDLVVIVNMAAFRVCAHARSVKTQAASGQSFTGYDMRGNMLSPVRPQIMKPVSFHGNTSQMVIFLLVDSLPAPEAGNRLSRPE